MLVKAVKRRVRNIPGAVGAYHNLRALSGVLYEGWFADRRRMNDLSLAGRAWDFEKPATRERYERVLAALTGISGSSAWARVLEIGCADGVFTAQLAMHSSELCTVDISEIACQRTRQRCAAFSNVSVSTLDLQVEPLPGVFDTVFAMDVLEFIHGRTRIHATAAKLAAAIRPGGWLVVSMSRLPEEMRNRLWARWLIEGGDNLTTFLDGRNGLRMAHRECYPRYLIAIYNKAE